MTGIYELRDQWGKTVSSYETNYVPHVLDFAQTAESRFRIKGLSFDYPDDETHRVIADFSRNNRWGFVPGAGPKAMLADRNYQLDLDPMGAVSSVFVAGPQVNLRSLFQVSYVLQMSQKVRVLRSLVKKGGVSPEKARDFKYYFHPSAIDQGYYPKVIMIGEQWKPLHELILMMGSPQWQCIEEKDLGIPVFVDDVDDVKDVLENQYGVWAERCTEDYGKRLDSAEPENDLLKAKAKLVKARKGFFGGYWKQAIKFADITELRARCAGFGSHLVGSNGEAELFGHIICSLGWDVVTGGGPMTMAEMTEAFQKLSAREAEFAHRARAIGMALGLPDEQTSAINVDFLFENDYFGTRLDGFGALAPLFVSKRKGGYGTLFELLWLLYVTAQSLEEGEHEYYGLLNPASRRYGYVPRGIAIGELYAPLQKMFDDMLAREVITEAQAKTLVCVDSLDQMKIELQSDYQRWLAACKDSGAEPVIYHAA